MIFVENPAKLGQFKIFIPRFITLQRKFKSLINQLPITDLIKSTVKTFTILLVKFNIIVAE